MGVGERKIVGNSKWPVGTFSRPQESGMNISNVRV